MEKIKVTVQTIINAPVDMIWKCWTDPKHIVGWNHASDDWHTTRAENDLRPGGRFLSRMEAKNGSFGFDFTGQYSLVEKHRKIVTLLDDNRIVELEFESTGEKTIVTETFETEKENSVELQRTGWQAILDNFKKYVEAVNIIR
jgi:uncharacterized protein YndB with AHSA1/START domain